MTSDLGTLAENGNSKRTYTACVFHSFAVNMQQRQNQENNSSDRDKVPHVSRLHIIGTDCTRSVWVLGGGKLKRQKTRYGEYGYGNGRQLIGRDLRYKSTGTKVRGRGCGWIDGGRLKEVLSGLLADRMDKPGMGDRMINSSQRGKRLYRN